MANMNEVLVDWTVGTRGGFVTVMYFDGTKSVSSARAALNTFLTTVKASLHTDATYTIRTAGRTIESSTGQLQTAWQDPPVFTGVGTLAGQIVPDAVQILVRWHTLVVLDGQRMAGRTFIPGLAGGNTTGGNLSASVITAIQGAGNTFAASANGPVIWHRPHRLDPIPPETDPPPGNKGDGAMTPVASCTVWNELAVLRRRRT